LAARLRARVVEAPLPVGLAGTERFLTVVGDALKRAEPARRCAAREARSAMRDTEAHVWRLLRGRAACLQPLPDPHLRGALAGLCADLGLRLVDAPAAGEVSLLIGSLMGDQPGVAFIPIHFGYPNFVDHPVLEKPFMGFSGFRQWVDRLSAAVMQFEADHPAGGSDGAGKEAA
jgi:hypothetical protein